MNKHETNDLIDFEVPGELVATLLRSLPMAWNREQAQRAAGILQLSNEPDAGLRKRRRHGSSHRRGVAEASSDEVISRQGILTQT